MRRTSVYRNIAFSVAARSASFVTQITCGAARGASAPHDVLPIDLMQELGHVPMLGVDGGSFRTLQVFFFAINHCFLQCDYLSLIHI